jgi:hypothetical protein
MVESDETEAGINGVVSLEKLWVECAGPAGLQRVNGTAN